tara:strand:+ start:927 stop:1208 length:282 start_codon:yes stop_codon:yes gene_type:complete
MIMQFDIERNDKEDQLLKISLYLLGPYLGPLMAGGKAFGGGEVPQEITEMFKKDAGMDHGNMMTITAAFSILLDKIPGEEKDRILGLLGEDDD